jgi:broad specificity phosphatase PhoE
MPHIYMIRHGEAAASWDKDADPGLSALGYEQAEQVAAEIAARVAAPLPIFTSPMRRCRETAEVLATLWKTEAWIEPRVIEVPSPVTDLKERHLWLRGIMKGDWETADEGAPALKGWRTHIIEALKGLQQDTVIFSHFIAINAAASYATHDKRVVHFMPDNCSVTLFEADRGGLRLLERGREMVTRVN